MLSILMVLRKFYSVFIFLLLVNCKNNQKVHFNQLRGYALGTTYSISYSSSKLSKNLLSQKIDSIINVINVSMSTYDKDSDISKINKGDSLLEVDTHFIKVYNKATEVWKKTKGYFDPTVGALVNAYGFVGFNIEFSYKSSPVPITSSVLKCIIEALFLIQN